MHDTLRLDVPNSALHLHPGDHIKLSRFDLMVWRVNYGWYEWGGNRPVCGWYLQSIEDLTTVKPLQLPDLYDIYLIER